MPIHRVPSGRGFAQRPGLVRLSGAARAAALTALLSPLLTAPVAVAQQYASAGSHWPSGFSGGIPGAVATPAHSSRTPATATPPSSNLPATGQASSPTPDSGKNASVSSPTPGKPATGKDEAGKSGRKAGPPAAKTSAKAPAKTSAKASARSATKTSAKESATTSAKTSTTASAKPAPAATQKRPAAPAAAASPPPVELASRQVPHAASAGYGVPHVHPDFDEGRVPFAIRFNGIESSWNRMAAFVMPGANLDFDVKGGSGSFSCDSGGGRLVEKGPSSWTWTAPKEHGDHAISVRDERSGEVALLRVFVLHPYDGSDRIGTYPVGRYQAAPRGGDPAYNRPGGFVEVTERNVDMQLTPHFRLSQFLCREESDWPKYVAMRTELLVKLETLLDALARRGLPADSLHVMSAFRTPQHNREAGLETTYSRHTYGDAADVFLDRDGDGLQDDLNHDGKVTREDARVLYDLVEGTLDKALPPQMVGGLSVYGRTGAHGPYIHLDTRGTRIRW